MWQFWQGRVRLAEGCAALLWASVFVPWACRSGLSGFHASTRGLRLLHSQHWLPSRTPARLPACHLLCNRITRLWVMATPGPTLAAWAPTLPPRC